MRVFIADDSSAVVERLTDLLEEVPGAQLVGQAGDVPEAIRSIQKTNPDAVGPSVSPSFDLHELPEFRVSQGMLECWGEFLP